MDTILEQMLARYETHSIYDKKNALKEGMQEVVLCGLSRAGFFREAAFYGGTALRIFYGLDRFSEDLDFSLVSEDQQFALSAYFPVLEKEIASYGLRMTAQEKTKSQDSHIQSAFLKGNPQEHLLLFYGEAPAVAPNEVIKIKFEVDVEPPAYAGFEHRYRLLPAPYEIRLYDAPSLFAGKIHAVLCRGWQNRVKGRDLYDYVFYLSRATPVNLRHLAARLVQSGAVDGGTVCTLARIKTMLCDKFGQIDYAQARQDVEPFLRDTSSLNLWSTDFFRQITEALSAQ